MHYMFKKFDYAYIKMFPVLSLDDSITETLHTGSSLLCSLGDWVPAA